MISKEPLLSIVIPTYNGSAFIEKTIQSVFTQTFTDWELIITDDMSSDNTVQLVQNMISQDVRCQLVLNTEPNGAVSNWNYGFRLARGKYFKLLCQDDILDDSCLQQQVEILENNIDIGIVTGLRKIINSCDKKVLTPRSKYVGLCEAKTVILESIRKGGNIIGEPSFVMFRSDSLRECGGFSEDWKYLVDLATYEKVAQNQKIFFINSVQGSFRISRSSWSHTLAKQQMDEFVDFSCYILNKYHLTTRKILRRARRAAFIRSYLRRILFLFS